MARSHKYDVLQDDSGNPIVGATVTVKQVSEAGVQGANATIYSSEGGSAKGNPFTTATGGWWEFWADTGLRYDIVLSAPGAGRTIRWDNGWLPLLSVDTGELANAAVTGPKLATAAVDENAIGPLAVGSSELKDNAVIAEKMAASALNQWVTLHTWTGFIQGGASTGQRFYHTQDQRWDSSTVRDYLPLPYVTAAQHAMAGKTPVLRLVGAFSANDYNASMGTVSMAIHEVTVPHGVSNADIGFSTTNPTSATVGVASALANQTVPFVTPATPMNSFHYAPALTFSSIPTANSSIFLTASIQLGYQ